MDAPDKSLAVEVRRLSKAFGASWALRGIDLDLRRGETLILVGPNGAGKTTLVKLLATLLRPTEGGGRILGCDLTSDPMAIRSRIGMLAHGSHLYGDLTALENLRFSAAMGGLQPPPETFEEALHRVDLLPHAHERVRRFSIGMKRRLSVARLLLGSPELLLLDEPYTNLDQQAMKVVNGVLQEFRDRGGAAVVATHHLSGGFPVADRIAILKAGRLVFEEARGEMSLQALQELYRVHGEGS